VKIIDIIITDKCLLYYADSIRRDIKYPPNIPLGRSCHLITPHNTEKITSCCAKNFYCHPYNERSLDDNNYLEYVYSMYQNPKLTDQEMNKIKVLLNQH